MLWNYHVSGLLGRSRGFALGDLCWHHHGDVGWWVALLCDVSCAHFKNEECRILNFEYLALTQHSDDLFSGRVQVLVSVNAAIN